MGYHAQKLFKDSRSLFWLLVFLLLVVVEILVRTRTLSPASYAAPSEIARAVPSLFLEMGFLEDLLATIWRTLIALALGFPLGVLTALVIYSLGRAQSSGEMLLDFVRSIPITTLIPLFIAIYGVGEKNKVVIGTFSALLVTAVTVWVGIKEERNKFGVLLHLYRPSYPKKMFLIVLPYVLPTMIAALRLAASSTLVLVVVAEMFVGTRMGIGKVINDMTYGDNRAAQYAVIVCAGILGYALNHLLEWLRRRVVQKYHLA